MYPISSTKAETTAVDFHEQRISAQLRSLLYSLDCPPINRIILGQLLSFLWVYFLNYEDRDIELCCTPFGEKR
jgi:hypothetical protein